MSKLHVESDTRHSTTTPPLPDSADGLIECTAGFLNLGLPLLSVFFSSTPTPALPEKLPTCSPLHISSTIYKTTYFFLSCYQNVSLFDLLCRLFPLFSRFRFPSSPPSSHSPRLSLSPSLPPAKPAHPWSNITERHRNPRVLTSFTGRCSPHPPVAWVKYRCPIVKLLTQSFPLVWRHGQTLSQNRNRRERSTDFHSPR